MKILTKKALCGIIMYNAETGGAENEKYVYTFENFF